MKKILVASVLLASSTSAFALYDDVCNSSYEIFMKPSTPTENFEIPTNNNVVIDKKLKLMWMRCAVGEDFDPVNFVCKGSATMFDWAGALAEVDPINAGTSAEGSNFGYPGWRMPNIKELMSIVEHQCADPALNSSLFPGASGLNVWSSTPFPSESGTADPSLDTYPSTKILYVNFTTGMIGDDQGDSSGYYIRLVRDYTE